MKNKKTCEVCKSTYPTKTQIRFKDIFNLTLIIIFSVVAFYGVIYKKIDIILLSVTGLACTFVIAISEILKSKHTTYEEHIKDCEAWDESEMCPKCKGTGKVTVTLGDGYDITEDREICPVCEGSGLNEDHTGQ